MKKQQFLISVSLQSAKGGLQKTPYEYEGFPERNVNNRANNNSHCPGIPMLLHNYDPESDAQIVFLVPAGNAAKSNFEVFKQEIIDIPNNPDIDEKLRRKFEGKDLISTAKVITIPAEENREKSIAFFNDLCAVFIEEADLYMDITFGTKVHAVSEFSTLVYAENARLMNIREVIYGKLDHAKNIGKIYDVKFLYRMVQSLNTAAFVPGSDLTALLDSFK